MIEETTLRQAETALATAIETGAPAATVASARKTCEAARAKLVEVQAEAERVQRAEAGQLTAAAQALCVAEAEALAGVVDRILAGIGKPPTPGPEVRVAEEMIAARQAQATAQGAARATQDRIDQLRERLAAKQAERHVIIERRTADDLRASDGADLALIQADGEILGTRLQAEEATLTDQAQVLAEARTALQAAERRWASARGRAWYAGTLGLADILENALAAVAAARRQYAAGHAPYEPSNKAFLEALHFVGWVVRSRA